MRKTFDELTITDDFMFCKVMQNERICKRLLNSVLKEKIGEIASIEYQKTVMESGLSRGTRMDVWVTDEEGKVYDVEMQTVDRHDLAKRMRYYQSQIDMLSLPKAVKYCDLPDSFIIFFCAFDYPKKALPVYTFRSICEEQPEVVLKDGVTKIIINSSAVAKEENEDLRAFMELMNHTESTHPFAMEVNREVRTVKDNDVFRSEYFSWYAKACDLRDEGREEGRREGIEQGASLTIIRQIQRKLAKGCDAEQIADALEEEPDVIEEIIAAIKEAGDGADAESVYRLMLERQSA